MWRDRVFSKRKAGDSVYEKILARKLPVIVCGAGLFARTVTRLLNKNGIDVSSYAVDGEYFAEKKSFCDRPVVLFDEVISASPPREHIFVLGMQGNQSYQKIKHFFQIPDIIKFFVTPTNMAPITCDYIKEHFKEFDATYEWLSDDLSKETFLSFLSAKTSGDYSGNIPILAPNQYFNELTKNYRSGVFVDCGAFSGDTVEEYIDWSGGTYEKIYAIEADSTNMKQLAALVKERQYHDVELIPCGVWNEKTELEFSQVDSENPASFSIDSHGTRKIPVNTIDNIVKDNRVSYIKMDIEGAELFALHGAKKTIMANSPAMAICVYHRSEDLVTIPQYIKSLESGSIEYQLFLRKHQWADTELVLYAIPYTK